MTTQTAVAGSFSTFGVLVRRSLETCRRMPALVMSPLIMSAFFLLIYDGQLSNAAAQFVPGGSYVSFLVPLVLLTTAFSGGAIAGQLMLRDLDSGYYACMALTPAPRWTLALAPMTAGVIAIALQSVALIGLGWVLGLDQPHGVIGAGVVVGLTVVAGGGFLLMALAAALISRTMAAVNGVTYVFFPLSFMTTTFMPADQLTGWMSVAAKVNPLTYLLEGMRDAFSPGWDASALIGGSAAAGSILLMGVVAVWFGIRRSSEEVDR